MRDSIEDDLRTGTPYRISSGIPERFPLRKFHRRSLILSPSLPSFFPALSLALVFARAPLSERLEQAMIERFGQA